jgi:enoyl-CoA hydratase
LRFEHVRVSRDQQTCRLDLSGRPLGGAEAAELVRAVEDLAEDRSVRVVVLGSRGPDFCPGIDTASDPTARGLDPPAAIAALHPPVVAAVHGRVESVGLSVALSADIVVAGETAKFLVPDVRAGHLPPWGAVQRLVRAVGAPVALSMLLLGEELDAPAALSVGLAHRMVADSQLDETTAEVVVRLLGVGPLAAELAKEAVRAGAELPMRDGFRLEADLNHLLATSVDRAEGLRAFFEKRPPRFEGR